MRLRDCRDALLRDLRNDSSGIGGWRLGEFLISLRDYDYDPLKVVAEAVSKGVGFFKKYLPEVIRAEGERIVNEAEACAITENAAGDKEIKLAIAAEIRAQSRRKDLLLAELLKRGIDMDGEMQANILRIAVTKVEKDE